MSVLTLRYAHAFSEAAKAGNLDIAIAQGQLHDFAETMSGSLALREFLENPSIDESEKLKIVDAVTSRIGVYPQVRNFIALMMKNERLNELNEILDEYAAVADEETNTSEATITTARPLDEAGRAELEASVAKLAGGPVKTTYHEDSTLLGGAIVRIGSTIYDGSVRAQLEQLKQKLINA